MSTEIKTKKLKRYESSNDDYLLDSISTNEMKSYSPFGPIISKIQLPEIFIDKLNTYADNLVTENKSSEFTLPYELVFDGGKNSLATFIEDNVRSYINVVEGSEPEKITLDQAWIVSMFNLTPSPIHFHSSDISGVLYLKEASIDSSEEEKTYISNRQAGYINFIIGGKQNLAKSLISFKPKIGDCYIFPSWLLHGAEPFNGEGERRSMAFNLSYKSSQ